MKKKIKLQKKGKVRERIAASPSQRNNVVWGKNGGSTKRKGNWSLYYSRWERRLKKRPERLV